MGSAGVARLVWPGMILAGLLLAAFVWAAWPALRRSRTSSGGGAPAAAPREEEPVRVLAGVEPERAAGFAPAPVPSELELAGDYVQESPEELGAKPLPGVVVTPEPPPVAG